MSSKRLGRKRKKPTPKETKRRELQGYLDKLRRKPNKTKQDYDLQNELAQALSSMKRS